ncbi:MAG: LamG domain-containing protein, partial [Candidatus Omnitrophota bacterium]
MKMLTGRRTVTEGMCMKMSDTGRNAQTKEEVMKKGRTRDKSMLRNVIIVLAVSCVAMMGASPIFAAVTYEDSLVSYWDFDDGSGTVATDAAGVNHGTLYNDPVWTTGKFGGALSFDGVNDYGATPSTLDYNFQSNPFAVSFWIKTTTTVAYMNVVGYAPHTGAGWDIFINNGKPDTTYYNIVSFDQNTPVNDGSWHHEVIVDTGTTLLMYHNGILDKTGVFSGPVTAYGTLKFGKNFHSYLNGTIDDVAIWDRALDANEVASIYSVGVQGFEGILNGVTSTFGALGYTTAQIDQLTQLYADSDPLAELVFDDVTWTYTADSLPDDTGYEIGDSWTTANGRYCVKLGSGLLGTPLGVGDAVPELPAGMMPFIGMVLGFGIKLKRRKKMNNKKRTMIVALFVIAVMAFASPL